MQTELQIPDNIEELIAAYLKEQAARYPKGIDPHLIVYTSLTFNALEVVFSAGSWDIETPESRFSSSLSNSVDQFIRELAEHDPLKKKREALEKLASEIAQLESEAHP